MILGLLAAAAGSTGGCAGADLDRRARDLRGTLKAARANGAYRCAPRALAIAEARTDFAERSLQAGDYFGAREHLLVADANAQRAFQDSPPERCLNEDADRDAVADQVDRCPAQAEDRDGFEDADGCPEPDNDKDGLQDGRDKCPDEPEDGDGFKDDDGCPDPDNDEDGHLDGADRCPGEPGPPGGDGCPAKFRFIEVTPEKIELRQTIYFQTNEAGIMSRSFPLLDEVAMALKARPTMKVRIEGHTDARGNRQLNTSLSQARADAVKAYLVGHGVGGDRLEARGFGPDQPIETNKTAAGREKNRRVEFVITQP